MDYNYDPVGNRITQDTTDSLTNYYANNLNQYTQLKKTKDTVPIQGAVSNSVISLDVNGTDTPINPDRTFQKDILLNEGPNSIIATAYDNAGIGGEDVISLTLTPRPESFTYDLKGNLTRRVIANPAGDETISYIYDYENRLTHVIASPSQTDVAISYDYLGRRIQKDVTTLQSHNVTSYIYDGDQVILETNSEGTVLTKYIYGPGIDEPIRLERGSNICYYHLDGLGSVIDLSNSAGGLVEHYDYDVFGNIKSPLSAVGNRFYFTAREYDEETGLYYYRARYYDPKLGRFLSADPVGYSAGINLYRYCSNNPINFIDPFGKENKPPRREYIGSTTELIEKILKFSKEIFTDWEISQLGTIPAMNIASAVWKREKTIEKAYELIYQITNYWLYIYDTGYTEVKTENGGTFSKMEYEIKTKTEYTRTQGGCYWNAIHSVWIAIVPNPNGGSYEWADYEEFPTAD